MFFFILLASSGYAAVYQQVLTNYTNGLTESFGPGVSSGRSMWSSFLYNGPTGRIPLTIAVNINSGGVGTFTNCSVELWKEPTSNDVFTQAPNVGDYQVIANSTVMQCSAQSSGLSQIFNMTPIGSLSLTAGFNYTFALRYGGGSTGSATVTYISQTNTYAAGNSWCNNGANINNASWFNSCGNGVNTEDLWFEFNTTDTAVTNPIATINTSFPTAGYRYTTSNLDFLWSTANVTMNNINVSLYVDNIFNKTFQANISGNVLTNFTNTTLKNGSHTYYIQYWNLTNAINTTTITFTVDSLPRINQTFPLNNNPYNGSTMYFFTSANVTDTVTNASLYVDNVFQKASIIATGTNVVTNYTGISLADGQHTWFMSYDVDGVSFNTTTAAFNFTNPMQGPIATVNQTFPTGGFRWTTSSNDFFWSTANITMNGINVSLYVDNILNTTMTANSGSNVLSNFTNVTLKNGSHTYFVQYWNLSTAINSSTVTFTVDSLPRLNTSFPQNNTQYNYSQISFSATVNATDNGRAAFFLDGVSASSVAISPGTNVLTNFSNTVSGGTHTWFMSYDVDGVAFNTTPNTFFVDLILPTMVSNFVNNTLYGYGGPNIVGQFNFSDNDVLFMWNVTIDGTSQGSQRGLSTNFSQFNLSVAPNTLSSSIHFLNVTQADGHTSYALKDSYDIATDLDSGLVTTNMLVQAKDEVVKVVQDIFGNELYGNALDINTVSDGIDQNIHISAEDSSPNDVFKTDQQIDRYKFTYIPETPKDTYTFDITSTSPIYLVENDKTTYKSWLVMGDKWVDFKLLDEPNEQTLFHKIDDNTVTVTISGLQHPELLQFQSIGELNIVSQLFYFYVNTNSSIMVNSSSVLETVKQQINLTVFKANDTLTTNTGFIYNGISYPPTQVTSNSTVDIYSTTFYVPLISPVNTTVLGNWNLTIVGSNNTIQTNYSFNQTVFQIQNNNCSSGASGQPALNWTVQDEDTQQPIPANISGSFSTYATDNSLRRTFALTWSTNDSSRATFSLCTYPNLTMYTDYVLVVKSYTYGTRTIPSNVSSSISGQILTWNTISSVISLVQNPVNQVVTLFNQFGTAIKNYLLTLNKYYPTNNTYAFAQSATSDFQGNSLFSINPTSQYQVLVYNTSGQQVFDTSKFYFVANPTIITIQVGGSPVQGLSNIAGINAVVQCNNATQYCSFTWNDISGGTVVNSMFNVFRMSAFGKQPLYYNNLSGSSGILNYTITENVTGKSYYAEASVFATDGNTYLVGTAELSYPRPISSFGSIGTVLYSAMMLLIVTGLIFIDVGPTGVIVGTLIGLGAGSLIGILPYSWASMVILICLVTILLWGITR